MNLKIKRLAYKGAKEFYWGVFLAYFMLGTGHFFLYWGNLVEYISLSPEGYFDCANLCIWFGCISIFFAYKKGIEVGYFNKYLKKVKGVKT